MMNKLECCLLILILAALGCAISEAVLPTPMPTATLTPTLTYTPSPTFTSTPTPTPGLQDVVTMPGRTWLDAKILERFPVATVYPSLRAGVTPRQVRFYRVFSNGGKDFIAVFAAVGDQWQLVEVEEIVTPTPTITRLSPRFSRSGS